MFEEFYEEAWDESAKVIYIRKVKVTLTYLDLVLNKQLYQ